MIIKLVLLLLFFIWGVYMLSGYVYPLLMRFIVGKKKYLGTTVKSYGGFIEDYKWYKTDDEALKSMRRYDFVERVYPDKKRLRPKK